MKTGSTPVEDANGRGHSGGRTVKRALWTATGLTVALFGASFTDVGQSYEGPVIGAFQAVRQGVRDRIDRARASTRNIAIEQQVKSRLRGDSTFDGDQIELHVVDDGTVVLEGLIADVEAKDKAVILARDTRGVLRVIDHLAVPPPPRVISARPDTGAEAGLAPAAVAVGSRTNR